MYYIFLDEKWEAISRSCYMFVVLEDSEVGNGLQVCQHVVGCDPCVVQFGSEKCENLGHYTDCYAEKKAGFDRSTTKMLADLQFDFSKHQNPRPPPGSQGNQGKQGFFQLSSLGRTSTTVS